MVNDQEPRYRLVDSNGNVVGSLFQNGDGNVEIQDETGTGSVFGPDGIVTPAIDAESVSTGEISIGDHSNIQGFETGTVTQNAVDSSTEDDTWGTFTNTTQSVSFSQSFDETPTIVIAPNRSAGTFTSARGIHQVENISTTGFDWEFVQFAAGDFSDVQIAIDYVAVEQ